MEEIYYSPRGYWKGKSAVRKLAKAAKVTEKEAFDFLKKQDVWQIFLPPPKKIVRPKVQAFFDPTHQADLLSLTHDRVGKKTYKYALTVVDVGSRYKEAEPLTTKNSKEVAEAFRKIYERHLSFPKLLQVDPGREFMGAVSRLMAERGVIMRRGRPDVHTDQAVVERFNRTLSERLYAYQHDKEMKGENVNEKGFNEEWVKRLPEVIKTLNRETDPPPKKIEDVDKGQSPVRPFSQVRYLYQLGEYKPEEAKSEEDNSKENKGWEKRRATDPIWSVKKHEIDRHFVVQGIDVYQLKKPAPQRNFVREELMVVD